MARAEQLRRDAAGWLKAFRRAREGLRSTLKELEELCSTVACNADLLNECPRCWIHKLEAELRSELEGVKER